VVTPVTAAATETAAERTLAASVIVPVRDGLEELEELVAALAAQTAGRSRFEVIVGDDGSTDGALDDLETADGWLRVSRGPQRSSYAARNRCAGLARAPALAFCDADCRPEPGWLEAGLAALEGSDLAAGSIRFQLPERRTIWTLLDLDTFLDQERAVRAGRAATANLFVRHSVFARMGGFDAALPNTGDHDFVLRCVRAGARLVFAPGAVVCHPSRDDARALLRKVWAVNRRYAERESRAGRRPNGLRLREWVPVVQVLRSRRRFERSVGLDRRRLREHGVRPTIRERAWALAAIYVLFPYLGGAAQLYGWWEGRRRS
jgi:GT2 family glycosyltransferase